MSSEWLKWTKGLTRKAEVLQIAARLMIPPTQAAGTLMLAMEWLDDAVTEYDKEGNACVTLGALPNCFIDTVVGVTGFSETLVEVGWMRITPQSLIFINAERHNGKTAKNRALARDRVAAFREKKKSPDVTISSLLPLISISKGMEGVKGEPKPQEPEMPDWLKKPWSDWVAYHKERKFKPYTSIGMKAQITRLTRMGMNRAVAAIELSMAQNWQGIFEERSSGKQAELPIEKPRRYETANGIITAKP